MPCNLSYSAGLFAIFQIFELLTIRTTCRAQREQATSRGTKGATNMDLLESVPVNSGDERKVLVAVGDGARSIGEIQAHFSRAPGGSPDPILVVANVKRCCERRLIGGAIFRPGAEHGEMFDLSSVWLTALGAKFIAQTEGTQVSNPPCPSCGFSSGGGIFCTYCGNQLLERA